MKNLSNITYLPSIIYFKYLHLFIAINIKSYCVFLLKYNLVAVDMFPHTTKLEMVMLFERVEEPIVPNITKLEENKDAHENITKLEENIHESITKLEENKDVHEK